MPKGHYPREYFQSSTITLSRPEIYELIDAYTGEFFADELALHEQIDLIVVLPPLSYDGRFTKGLFISQAVDLVLDRFPVLQELFASAAYSMWCSHPWSRLADAFLVCYDNPDRTAWFREKNPDRRHISHIPLQDADYTNEYLMAPVRVLERDIDLLCVSRLHALKNLPLVASALAIYRKKHPLEPIRMTLIAGKPGAYAREQMSQIEREQYGEIEAVLGQASDYIDFVEHAHHFRELPTFYSRARAYVLGSLLEGKNRCLNEAQCCDTPVICFAALNQYARGSTPSFAEGGGLTADYDAEAMADTIYEVLSNEDCFQPRAAYLSNGGRRRFLNQCLAGIPYFAAAIPGIDQGSCWDNLWIDLAMQDNYGLALHDFVYGRAVRLSHGKGLEKIGALANFYSQKFAM
jgi:glycosyltransferase involved in cell wall biosynthesis